MIRSSWQKEKYVRQRDNRKICRLKKSCLSDSEKKQVMDMFKKYKDTFSLRDEIGTCLNIEVEKKLQINLHFY